MQEYTVVYFVCNAKTAAAIIHSINSGQCHVHTCFPPKLIDFLFLFLLVNVVLFTWHIANTCDIIHQSENLQKNLRQILTPNK